MGKGVQNFLNKALYGKKMKPKDSKAHEKAESKRQEASEKQND